MNFENNIEKKPEEIANENFLSWNESLQTKDAKEVSKKYASEGELFGTVSSKIRTGKEEIEGYFEHFLQIDPMGAVIERRVINTSPHTYIDTGLYNFDVVKDGQKETIEAMFTYVWQKNSDDEWEIIHHHSAVKEQINEKLTEQLDADLYDDKGIQWGTDCSIGENIVLKTGFAIHDEKNVRFTVALQENQNGEKNILMKQVSEVPEDHGV